MQVSLPPQDCCCCYRCCYCCCYVFVVVIVLVLVMVYADVAVVAVFVVVDFVTPTINWDTFIHAFAANIVIAFLEIFFYFVCNYTFFSWTFTNISK